MPDYKKMYLSLINAVEKALEEIESYPEEARLTLIDALQDCENIYIDSSEREEAPEV